MSKNLGDTWFQHTYRQANKNVLLRMEGEIVGSTTSAGVRKRT